VVIEEEELVPGQAERYDVVSGLLEDTERDVEVLGVSQDPDLRTLTGLRARDREHLNEVVDDLRALPYGIVQDAVDDRADFHVDGSQARLLLGAGHGRTHPEHRRDE